MTTSSGRRSLTKSAAPCSTTVEVARSGRRWRCRPSSNPSIEQSSADETSSEETPADNPATDDTSAEQTATDSSALKETQRLRRGHAFYPDAKLAASIPSPYATERVPVADKTIHLHYFAGGADWWIVEYDKATGEAFGYACIGDPAGAEWGWSDLTALEEVQVRGGLVVIERDLYWEPKTVREAGLPGIRATHTAAAVNDAVDRDQVATAPAPSDPGTGYCACVRGSARRLQSGRTDPRRLGTRGVTVLRRMRRTRLRPSRRQVPALVPADDPARSVSLVA